MAEQLPLDLPARAALGRGDFFVSGANARAVERLDRSDAWVGGKLVLIGPEGAGKTHLAHVWAGDTGARIIEAPDLNEEHAARLDGPVVIERADALPETAEAALFHLHNVALAEGWPLLLTARTAPSRWTIRLPDLKSRLEAAEVVNIAAPDDALLSAVLVKLFADRQIPVTPALVRYIVTRMHRSFAAAQALVETLDREALAQRRPVTRDLARRILDRDA